MSIDLPDLQLVRAVAQEGTLTGAAEQLYLTQPALSYRLKTLEERLGGKLFERGGRRMRLTPMGERLLETAGRVLKEVAEAEADLGAIAAGRKGTLRIASECYTSYHWLPPILRAFAKRYPDVDVRIVAEATEEPIPSLLDGRLDVAILTKMDGRASELRLSPLFRDEMVAVVAEGHPWTTLPHAQAEDFAGEHLILYQSYARDRRPPRPLPLPPGAVPARLTTLPMTTEAVIEMVKAGMGVTVMASWAAAGYLAGEPLRSVPVTAEGLWRTWHAATRPDQPEPLYLQDFIGRLGDIQDHLSARPSPEEFASGEVTGDGATGDGATAPSRLPSES